MKKLTSILCLLLLLAVVLSGCGQASSDTQAEELCFPGLNWNMTPDQVRTALKLSDGDYAEASDEYTYAMGVEHYEIFGTDARLVIEFSDFNQDGTHHLKKVTLGFSTDADMEAIEAELTTLYGESRPIYETGSDWYGETLCRDLMTESQVSYLSGITTLDDVPDSPASEILLRTNSTYAYYNGETTNNAVFFASNYSYITLEGGYAAP